MGNESRVADLSLRRGIPASPCHLVTSFAAFPPPQCSVTTVPWNPAPPACAVGTSWGWPFPKRPAMKVWVAGDLVRQAGSLEHFLQVFRITSQACTRTHTDIIKFDEMKKYMISFCPPVFLKFDFLKSANSSPYMFRSFKILSILDVTIGKILTVTVKTAFYLENPISLKCGTSWKF